jgi:phytoene dehydrogenase-like protein
MSPSFEACTRGAWNEETVPLILVQSSDYDGGPVRPAFIMASLDYGYADRWATGPNRERGREYMELKRKATRTIIGRFDRRLPKGFKDAVRFAVAATPLTMERYTNNAEGSFMGFHIRAGEYGRFFPHSTPVNGLYFAGQWVYPGFGVGGVAASGYYCAKKILEKTGTDIDAVIAAGKRGAA